MTQLSYQGSEHMSPSLMDPTLQTLTPRHSQVFRRYQMLRTVVDFGAAACFVSGSVCFLFSDMALLAARLFLVGSVLFAMKPTIDMVRAFHLGRIQPRLTE